MISPYTAEELEAATALLALSKPARKRVLPVVCPAGGQLLPLLADEVVPEDTKRPRLRARKQAHPRKIVQPTPSPAPEPEPEPEAPAPAPKPLKENFAPTFTPGWGSMYYHNQHNIKIHAPVEVTLGPTRQGMVGSIILVVMHSDKQYVAMPVQHSRVRRIPAFKLTTDYTYETGFYPVPGYNGVHPGYKIFFTDTPKVDLTFTKLSTDEEGALFRARYWSLVAFRSQATSKADISTTPIQVVKEFRPDRTRRRHKREHLLLDEHCVSSCLDFDTVTPKHLLMQMAMNLIDHRNKPANRQALVDFYKFGLAIVPETRCILAAKKQHQQELQQRASQQP